MAASKLAGIHANNTYPAQFIYENLCSAIHWAHRASVRESYKREYGREYRTVIPQPVRANGNFHLENSHVIPALMRRFHEAVRDGEDVVTIWGSGRRMREFLHVDDMAAASVHVMELPADTYRSVADTMLSHISVGTGVDCTIRELAETLAEVTGFRGRIEFDASKPDGTARKLLDVAKLQKLGWSATIALRDYLKQTYEWFLAQENHARL